MSFGLIELIGSDVFCSINGGAENRLALGPALAKLQGWSKRYDDASRRNNEGELVAIGREMFAWLDDAGWVSAWAEVSGERNLEIRVKGGGGPEEEALLDAPWELLSRADGPLALNDIQLFVVARRIGKPEAPVEPRHADLQLMFMAAAPEGQVELDFEAEEAAILEATQRLPIRVIVEETGSLDFLGGRLASDEGPFEALHLSCHGDIDAQKGPILLLEGAAGGEDRAGPGEIIGALGADPVPLVVLSACRTAERGRSETAPGSSGERESAAVVDTQRESGSIARGPGPELATPFVHRLATVIANVVGWDGSVYDPDATEFAQDFYKELAGRSPVPRAAAVARRALLRKKGQTPPRGQHWHLARVYVGAKGGGPLCANTKPKRASTADRSERAWLDKTKQRVPVATRAEFVGRRRDIQKVLRSFRDVQQGVLIHGMGALGKSSLAARLQNRMSQHRPVVIFERYDALAILDEVLEALDARTRLAEKTQWREVVKANSGALAEALETWLSGPLDMEPILLIVDDLERILETPSQSDAATGVMRTYGEALAAVLVAFERAHTRSRLLVTSRYDFRLPDGEGGDLAERLVRVPLAPMRMRERIKQWRAAERVAGRETAELDETEKALLSRALDAAAGNPGLQGILTQPILSSELAAAEEALDAIDVYRATGVPPAEIETLIAAGTAKDSENALIAFFARVSFATYRSALTPEQARQLTAATLFTAEVPIPRPALAAAGAALGVEAPEVAIVRLLGLGLLDDWGEMNAMPHDAANPLARPLAQPLDKDDRPRLARAALPHLIEAWRDAAGGLPPDPCGLEASGLAREAGAEPAILEAAALAGAAWLGRVNEQTREALDEIAATLALLPAGYAVGPEFLRLGVECASLLGETNLLERLLAAPVRPPASGDPKAGLPHAGLDLRRVEQLIRTGQMTQAETLTRTVLATVTAAGNDRMAAVTMGKIADILQARGELDEVLRIRREEELPVYERLGDARSRAVTMGQIADILEARGELDEALRIRREEQLPVFERLGEIRERALTMGKIADILEARGELDEALRIRREEELPVYERLGDVHSRAVTMGQIADILQARGELKEALRIRREEQLPVYERLGDVRERALTMGKIADILEAGGELDEALRIRREEELPVYERLGDVHSRAVTMGQIADILQARGELDEALRIRREEQLPVYERLGEVRSRAVTMGQIADILQDRGELDEALRIRREEQLPVYERLGDVRSRSATLFKIATVLLAGGELDQGRIQEVYDALEESFAIAQSLGLPEGIAHVGILLAQVLALGGHSDHALAVLDAAEAAFDKLGDADGATQIQSLRDQISSQLGQGSEESGRNP